MRLLVWVDQALVVASLSLLGNDVVKNIPIIYMSPSLLFRNCIVVPHTQMFNRTHHPITQSMLKQNIFTLKQSKSLILNGWISLSKDTTWENQFLQYFKEVVCYEHDHNLSRGKLYRSILHTRIMCKG